MSVQVQGPQQRPVTDSPPGSPPGASPNDAATPAGSTATTAATETAPYGPAAPAAEPAHAPGPGPSDDPSRGSGPTLTAEPATVPPAATRRRPRIFSRRELLPVLLVILLVAGFIGFNVWHDGQIYVSTDNAQLSGQPVQVGATNAGESRRHPAEHRRRGARR